MHVMKYSLKYLKRDGPLVPCEITVSGTLDQFIFYLTSANSRPPLWIALAALVGKFVTPRPNTVRASIIQCKVP